MEASITPASLNATDGFLATGYLSATSAENLSPTPTSGIRYSVRPRAFQLTSHCAERSAVLSWVIGYRSLVGFSPTMLRRTSARPMGPGWHDASAESPPAETASSSFEQRIIQRYAEISEGFASTPDNEFAPTRGMLHELTSSAASPTSGARPHPRLYQRLIPGYAWYWPSGCWGRRQRCNPFTSWDHKGSRPRLHSRARLRPLPGKRKVLATPSCAGGV
jgi:hypothetical protein